MVSVVLRFPPDVRHGLFVSSLLVTVLHVHPNEAKAAICNTNSITNKLTNKSCLTSGGKCNTTDTIYTAECTKHDLIYVGHSSQKLSGRFNGHHSDVKVKPKACELSLYI